MKRSVTFVSPDLFLERVAIDVSPFNCFGTGVHGQRGAYKLLLCYFGANIGYRAIRYDPKCRDALVIEIRRKVYDTLELIGERAMGDLTADLERHALIKSADKHYA